MFIPRFCRGRSNQNMHMIAILKTGRITIDVEIHSTLFWNVHAFAEGL